MPSAMAVPPTRSRFLIMVLLFVSVTVNYLDRSNLSIAAPSLANDFGIDPVQMGLVFSAFGWTYTPLQIPGGWLVDRVHPRVLYPVTILMWSLATLTLGLSSGFIMLIVMFSLAGVPPTIGFYAKFSVIEAAVNQGFVWLAVVAVLASLVGAFYYLRIVKLMYFDAPTDASPIIADPMKRALLAFNGLAVLVLGIVPGPLMNACLTAISHTLPFQL